MSNIVGTVGNYSDNFILLSADNVFPDLAS